MKYKKGGIIIGLPIIPNRTQEQAYVDIITSISLEEASLAHIINAEAEKIQAITGLMQEGQVSPNEVINFQNAIERNIRTTIKMQMLLEFKLENILNVLDEVDITTFENIGSVTGSYNDDDFIDTDNAYYHIVNTNNTVSGEVTN
jgi:hypothetical protein